MRAGHGVPGSRVVGWSRTRGIGPLWLIEVTGESGRKSFADCSSRTKSPVAGLCRREWCKARKRRSERWPVRFGCLGSAGLGCGGRQLSPRTDNVIGPTRASSHDASSSCLSVLRVGAPRFSILDHGSRGVAPRPAGRPPCRLHNLRSMPPVDDRVSASRFSPV